MTATRRRVSTLLLLLPLALLFLRHAAFSQTGGSRGAEYVIDVSLNPMFHTLDGTELLTWRNTSTQSIGVLEFHLYLNAFRSDRTSYMSESGRSIPGASRGWIDVLGITDLRTGQDLTGGMEYIQPDDQNPYDSTALAVKLTQPVGPRDSIDLRIKFHEQLPEAVSGWDGHRGRNTSSQLIGFPKLQFMKRGMGLPPVRRIHNILF